MMQINEHKVVNDANQSICLLGMFYLVLNKTQGVWCKIE